MKMITGISMALLALLLASQAVAQEPFKFESIEQEIRFQELTLELRCAVCQNQNLADSDAPLAQDLRQEIYDMMQAGRTDDEIKSFMVDRYGDFVLYRPPMKGNTLALWVLPIVLLGIGAITVFFTVRKRNRLLAEQQSQAAGQGE